MTNDAYVRGLLLTTVQILTSHPKAIVVESEYEADTAAFIVSVDPRDMATLGGNDGRIVHSLNHIVGAMGGKFGQSMSVEIKCRR